MTGGPTAARVCLRRAKRKPAKPYPTNNSAATSQLASSPANQQGGAAGQGGTGLTTCSRAGGVGQSQPMPTGAGVQELQAQAQLQVG